MQLSELDIGQDMLVNIFTLVGIFMGSLMTMNGQGSILHLIWKPELSLLHEDEGNALPSFTVSCFSQSAFLPQGQGSLGTPAWPFHLAMGFPHPELLSQKEIPILSIAQQGPIPI